MSILHVPGDSPSRRLRGKRVVVAETEGITVMMLHSALRREGAHVVAVCRSAAECVPLAQQEKPDLVLVALSPHNLSETISAVRQLSRAERSCIVIITSTVSDQDETHLRAAGAAGFVKMPFTVDQLLPLVEDTCSTRWTSAS